MVVAGVVLLLLGWAFGISFLYTVGVILVVVGLIFWVLGAMNHPVGGRAHYW